jgi:hypothetical protein
MDFAVTREHFEKMPQKGDYVASGHDLATISAGSGVS